MFHDWANSVPRTREAFAYHNGGRLMKNMNRLGVRAKILAGTAIALVTLSIAAPTKADNSNVRWRTIVGILQAGNMVGNIGGGGQPWTTLGGRARVDLAKSRVRFRCAGIGTGGRKHNRNARCHHSGNGHTSLRRRYSKYRNRHPVGTAKSTGRC